MSLSVQTRRTLVLMMAIFVLITAIIALASLSCFYSPEKILAHRFLKESGLTGGLIVHLGCGDGKLAAALAANGDYLVHGLERNAGAVEMAREFLRS